MEKSQTKEIKKKSSTVIRTQYGILNITGITSNIPVCQEKSRDGAVSIWNWA